MRRAFLALVFVCLPAAVARAEDEPNVVFTNAALYDAPGAFGLDIALRARVRDLRYGGLAQVAALPLGGERAVEARPLVVFDWCVHESRSARLWLGGALGPRFRFLADNDTHIGFTALLAFDVAVPLSPSLSFDVIVRAGGQIEGSSALARPDPVGQFLLGLTWEPVRPSSRVR